MVSLAHARHTLHHCATSPLPKNRKLGSRHWWETVHMKRYRERWANRSKKNPEATSAVKDIEASAFRGRVAGLSSPFQTSGLQF